MPANGLSSLLWFFAVIALIPLVLWLFKRSPAGARLGGGHGQGAMRTVASLALSPSQRIVTVEVGQGDERRWLVLGVAPNHISTLHSMAPQAEATASPQGAAPAFGQLLASLRRDKGADGGR